jgi:1-deoxy-D-xylulose-5-phosphate synthase
LAAGSDVSGRSVVSESASAKRSGGAGSAVAEFLAAEGIVVPLLQLGLPDRYVEHAKPAQMLAECGLDAAGIERAVRARLQRLGH